MSEEADSKSLMSCGCGSVAEWSVLGGLRLRRARVQIAVATLSGNSLKQTVHTNHASV